jgi:aminopeptidase N
MVTMRANIFLFLVLVVILPLKGQVKLHEISGCTPYCAHTRIKSSAIGIYNQDPRVHHYDVKFYGIELQVQPQSVYLEGTVRIVAEVVHTGMQHFVAELVDELTVSEVLSDGKAVSFSRGTNTVIAELTDVPAVNTLLDIEIKYSGTPQASGFFAGIQSRMNPFGEPVLWTLSEPHNARQWFPAKQVLNDKADSVYVAVTTPAGFIAASNGLLHSTTAQPDNRIRYEWRSFYPIAYYLISIAVANYQEFSFNAPLSTAGDSVLVQNFLYNHPQVLTQQMNNLLQTRPMMQLLSQLWGDYRFADEKYGHAQAPMGGAMEHQTMSTMGSFGFDITVHELAHHWYGNNVTCATWNDIWINEGFASYAEYMAREFLQSPESARQWMQVAHSNIKSVPGGSVYVPTLMLPDVLRIFDGRLSYRKGAAILHQLRFEINNDELFFFIMEDFQDIFADSVATGDDFRRTVELHTGQNWEWFFNQWYYGEGYPIYELLWWQENGKLKIRSTQKTSAETPGFFAGTLEFSIGINGQQRIVRFFQDTPVQEFEAEATGRIEWIEFDPRFYMLKSYTLLDSSDLNLRNQGIRFFPNPFTEDFVLRAGPAWINSRILIYDLSGRVVMEQKLEGSEYHSQNLVTLDTGLYIISLISPDGNKTSARIMKY